MKTQPTARKLGHPPQWQGRAPAGVERPHGHRFKLDGTQFGNDQPPGLVAMNAVASLTATHPRSKQFVVALWDTPSSSGPHRYYDGMLYLLALLHCSGEFRIWPPQ